jgi:hypothetical protein
MKITIENTDKIGKLNGMPARIWQGQTEGGVPVLAWVAMVSPQTLDADVNAQFERELQEVHPASPAGNRVYDMRYFVD